MTAEGWRDGQAKARTVLFPLLPGGRLTQNDIREKVSVLRASESCQHLVLYRGRAIHHDAATYSPLSHSCLGHFPGLNIQAIFTLCSQRPAPSVFIHRCMVISHQQRHSFPTYDCFQSPHASSLQLMMLLSRNTAPYNGHSMHLLLIQLRPSAACRGHGDIVSVLFGSMCLLS